MTDLDPGAVEREAIVQAKLAGVIFEELEEHGSGGENKTTYRNLAIQVLFDRIDSRAIPIEPQAPDVEPVGGLVVPFCFYRPKDAGDGGMLWIKRKPDAYYREPLYPAAAIDQIRRERDRWKDTAAAEAEAMEDQKRLYRSARTRAETAEAENAALREGVKFAARWAIEKAGNGTSDAERLSVIANHPVIKAALQPTERGEP